MDQVYKCYNCGKEFCENEWTLTDNGELVYECPRCHSIWYKEECSPEEIPGGIVLTEEENK
jgi:DNA-directed RNA polymerase subunit RPC12/RpoP